MDNGVPGRKHGLRLRSCSPLRITPASAVINRRRASREKTPYADTDFTKSSDTLAKVSSPDVKSCDGAAEACVKGRPPAAVGRHDRVPWPSCEARGIAGSTRSSGVVRRVGAQEVLDRTAAEHEALQQRVARQPVGPLRARAGDLAGGIQAGNRRAAPQVGAHATHPVVGGRGHGYGLCGPVVAGGEGGRRDGREPPGQEARAPLCLDAAGVQVDRAVRRGPGGGQVQGDAAGDDVAGGQFGVGVVVGHEAVSRGVQQHRALAADRFGDEQGRRAARNLLGGKGGGVELEELEVPHRGAGTPGQGQAVGGGDGGVAGAGKEPARHRRWRAGRRRRPAPGAVRRPGRPRR